MNVRLSIYIITAALSLVRQPITATAFAAGCTAADVRSLSSMCFSRSQTKCTTSVKKLFLYHGNGRDRNLISWHQASDESHFKRQKSNVGCHESASDHTDLESKSSKTERDAVRGMWSPNSRSVIAALAFFGAVETGYVSYGKLFGKQEAVDALCNVAGGTCGSVLDSPYAFVGGVPLIVFGFIAYLSVIILSVHPMVNLNLQRNQTTAAATSDNKASNTPDGVNRIILAALTTAMATFSMLLMALLVFVLKQSCVVCVTSAILSISMGILTWFGGADSDDNEGAFMAFRNGLVTRLASVILTIAATAGLYGSLGLPTDGDFTSSSSLVASSRSISASSDDSNEFTPPPVTASSNDRALTLAENLKLLNTRFFGAYWCSHCFEQKQTMGKDAMKNIPYIECSAEGKNSQADVCKKAKVPGYPTWEIGGKLFPGEMSIDELENIVRDVNVAKKS